MNPKLLITQAIQNTYDKCFPHVFTHDDFIKECDDMNKIFLKSFKTKILDSKVLAKIEKTIKIDEKDNHFYIDDYLHSVVSPASYIVNDYFYSKKLEAQALENKEHFNVLNILVEKTQNFYDNLISEIKSLNKVNYTQTEKEKAFHSHITGNSEALEYTPEELGAEFKIFSKTMKQQSLVACGDFSLSQVKTWLSGFNRESKNVMKNHWITI